MVVTFGVRVCDGLRCALADASGVHSWANRGEGDGEVVEGLCKRCTRVSNGNGDEVHLQPILLEGHDEREVLLGLLRVFLVASEVSGESNLQ